MLVRIRLFLLAIVAAAPAAAQGLPGADLGWQYYGGGGPLTASVTGSVTGGQFIVGSGNGEFIEPTGNGPLPIFDIYATDNTITFDYSPATPSNWSDSPFSLAPTIYNGIAINLLSSGSFSSVTVDPSTNMAGFGAGNISFTADQIEINWEGLAFNASTVVTLDVADPPAVPEPSTLGLADAGLCAAFALAARVRS
jgi:hypothetical protein